MSTSKTSTSTHSVRQSSYSSVHEEISRKIVPISAADFLDLFLPLSESMTGKAGKPTDKALKKIKAAKTGAGVCLAFVEAFQRDVLRNIQIVDNRARELPPMDGHIIKPDLIVVDDRSRSSAPSIEDVSLMGAVRFTDDDNPFNQSPLDFERKGAQAVETLGQIAAYAAAQMAAQFRSHIFSLLVFPNYARILQWDRAGVVVTHKIYFNKGQAPKLSEFLWRYDQASPTERGVDPNVAHISRRSVPPEVRKELGEHKHAFYRITLPASGCTSGEDRHFIVAMSQYMGLTSPVGRSSQCFKAYCETTGGYVFMKDTWRIIHPALIPEHETYARLAAAGVEFVATSSAHHDTVGRDTRTSVSRKHVKGTAAHLGGFKTLRNHRLVLDQYAKPILEFANLKEMVQVIRDCIKAHGEAFNNANILHCDISAGNIMIYNGRGLLIDWDLCKDVTHADTEPKVPKCVGTLGFLPIRLEKAGDENLPIAPHNSEDDLESFWFVMYWLSLMRGEHCYDAAMLVRLIGPIFERVELSDRILRPSKAKRYTALNNRIWQIISSPFQKLFQEFQNCARGRYYGTPKYKALLIKIYEETIADWPYFTSEIPIEKVAMSMAWRTSWTDVHLPSYTMIARDLKMMDPEWAVKLFDEALAEPHVDWMKWGENVKRKGIYDDDSRSSSVASGQHESGLDPHREAEENQFSVHSAAQGLKSRDDNIEGDDGTTNALGSPITLKRKLASGLEDYKYEHVDDDKENRPTKKLRTNQEATWDTFHDQRDASVNFDEKVVGRLASGVDRRCLDFCISFPTPAFIVYFSLV